jgi:hypothetical protein
MEEALEGRGHVVMCRVNDETLGALDALVEAGLCESRSAAAAFLIREGMKANEALFERIREVSRKIAELREDLRRMMGGQESDSDPAGSAQR